MVNERQVLVDYFYRVMWCEFSDIDALYEDYIVHMIGVAGLNILRESKRLEGCGVVNGRQLYSLDKTFIGVKKGEIVMEDFIIKLENMLYQSGYTDWKVIYMPDAERDEILLELDGDAILMSKLGVDYPVKEK